jgi:DNA invertase Pin-like site-specific DNA recombinase
MPEANELTIHIMAAVAQQERKAISQRTTDALRRAKARGVRLGNPRLKAGNRASALVASHAAKAAARERAEELRDTVEDARQQGHETLLAIAKHLNDIGIATPRGGTWAAASVARLLAQLDSPTATTAARAA